MNKRREITSRQRIIDAALEVFADLHFHEATIREIAQRAGISQAAVYKHFDGKDHILSCAAAERLHTMLHEVQNHLLGLRGTLTKLRKMSWYYLSVYEQDWRVPWLLYIGIPVKNWYELTQATQEGRETSRLYRTILHEGQKAGDVKKNLDVQVATNLYFGTLANITTGWLLRGRSYHLTDSADSFSEMVFDAVKAEEKIISFECPFLDKATGNKDTGKVLP
jgi:TetR/AcrR family fatty acid metabolism transcriptional regulator